MFLASKLVYAIKFYPIPPQFQKEIQDSIFQYTNFPNKVITIGQKEMWKTKMNGGCKLVNIQVKSETSKAKWLMEIATKVEFKINLETFSALVGPQKGNNSGRDLIFMNKSYISRILKTDSPFYKEAFKSLAIFNRRKGVRNVKDWDEENIFYNPLILSKTGKTIKETEYFRNNKIYKLGQLLEEKAKESRNLPYDRAQVALANNITLEMGMLEIAEIKEDMVFLGNTESVKMRLITQKQLYEDAILQKSGDHISQAKWVGKLVNTVILWEEVWGSVHNYLSSNKTRTAIWEQLHLNLYTQYSYNKWHKQENVCCLCNNIPESIFHIILHCDFVNTLWTHIQPTLLKLYPKPIDDQEKALGIVQIKKSNPGILLRNWLTYKIREQILTYERKSFHSPQKVSVRSFEVQFNQAIAQEVKNWMFRLNNEGNLSKFDELLAYKGILCKKISDGEYRLNKAFQQP